MGGKPSGKFGQRGIVLALQRRLARGKDKIIQRHPALGYEYLKGFSGVPDYVLDVCLHHHEKIDGKGYPRRLPAEQLGTADRVMALADVFEALTAADRPYKAPKTLSEALKIMAFMCKDQHLDTELFRYFLRSDVWHTFAERYLLPSQRDKVDVAGIEKLLPAQV